jgi:hypothetical protein
MYNAVDINAYFPTKTRKFEDVKYRIVGTPRVIGLVGVLNTHGPLM